MTRPPRVPIANLPTPVRPLDRWSQHLGEDGPRIWIKHDDDTGGVISGNKIRKLEYTLAEAQAAGADTLVTCGGIQSNHCRATAVAARRLGMDVTLCLRGTPPDTPPDTMTGNLLLDHVLGARIVWWTPEQYAAHTAGMASVAQALHAEGRRPFVIAEGCSMPSGVWGYIDAAAEIAAAEREHGVRFDAIVHAVGSGGTSAGLELGVRLHGLATQVHGVCACDDAATFVPHIAALCRETSARYDLGIEVSPAEIAIVDGYVGLGYGRARPEELRRLVALARTEGVVLDPVYSGKAMAGLVGELAGPRFAGMRNILFLHTGGVFGLAPHAASLSAL